jgi:hypothetical protein
VDISYSLKTVEVNGRKINIQLWDIPGVNVIKLFSFVADDEAK